MNKLRELLSLLKALQRVDNTGDAALMAGELSDPAYIIELEAAIKRLEDVS